MQLLSDLIEKANGAGPSLVVGAVIQAANVGLAPQVTAIVSIALLVEADPGLADAADEGLSILLDTPLIAPYVEKALRRIRASRKT